jgi:hypothetical protein
LLKKKFAAEQWRKRSRREDGKEKETLGAIIGPKSGARARKGQYWQAIIVAHMRMREWRAISRRLIDGVIEGRFVGAAMR